MTGVTCEAGNAHSSGAPDFTLQWRVHVVPFYLPIFLFIYQAFYCSTILVLFASVWTDFNVEEYIIGMRLQCCCIWIKYGVAFKNLERD